MTMFLDTSPLIRQERDLLLLVWRHGVITAETAQYELDWTAGELGNFNRRLLSSGLIRRERTATSKTVTYRCTQLGRILADAVNRGQRVELVEPTGRRRNRAPVREMVRLRLQGHTVREIADRLGYLNENTIRRHLRRAGLTSGRPGRPRRQAAGE